VAVAWIVVCRSVHICSAVDKLSRGSQKPPSNPWTDLDDAVTFYWMAQRLVSSSQFH